MPSVLDRSALEQSPLADLHLLANELGVDGFRRLRKPELVDAILARQTGEPAPDAAPEEEPVAEPLAEPGAEPRSEAAGGAGGRPHPPARGPRGPPRPTLGGEGPRAGHPGRAAGPAR